MRATPEPLQPTSTTVLVFDDAITRVDRAELVLRVSEAGFLAASVAQLREASTALSSGKFDVVVVRQRDGEEPLASVVDLVAERAKDVAVIAVLDGDLPELAILETLGVTDAITWPVTPDSLRVAIDRAVRVDPPAAQPAMSSVLEGETKPMITLRETLRRAAPGMATVLVRGESGTGKELVARALCEGSQRAERPFVKVHCAALPDTLLESELFGYEKGAFTGAVTRKQGRVDLAQGGTLFLDEIGDINASTQVKLLRLLQDRTYERLGGNQMLQADVRFITATHRDLESMVKKGEFREDLFYRLNVVTLWVPPLRARRDDIPLLIERFCERFAALHARGKKQFSPEATAALKAERWPGNVRQLQNFVERLVVLSDAPTIDLALVREYLTEGSPFATEPPSVRSQAIESNPTRTTSGGSDVRLDATLREAERRALKKALERAAGNRTLAARLLGVSRATLYNKLAEHGLG